MVGDVAAAAASAQITPSILIQTFKNHVRNLARCQRQMLHEKDF